jgi:hypothetical protein
MLPTSVLSGATTQLPARCGPDKATPAVRYRLDA